jgi:hypothetical protein
MNPVSYDETGRVDLEIGFGSREVAEGGDLVPPDSDVRAPGLASRPVDDAPTDEEDVVALLLAAESDDGGEEEPRVRLHDTLLVPSERRRGRPSSPSRPRS